MPGLKDFRVISFSPRLWRTKTTTYTVLADDEGIQCNGTFTATLPPLNSLQGTTTAKKTYRFDNISTTSTVTTISPGTNTVTNVADTIGGLTTYSLKPYETLVIEGSEGETDWKIVSPATIAKGSRPTWTATATTSGVTEVSVFGADGAPDNIVITNILATALVASVSPSTLYLFKGSVSAAIVTGSASLLLASMIPGSAIGRVAGITSFLTTAIAKGTLVTAMSGDTSASHYVEIHYTTQTLA